MAVFKILLLAIIGASLVFCCDKCGHNHEGETAKDPVTEDEAAGQCTLTDGVPDEKCNKPETKKEQPDKQPLPTPEEMEKIMIDCFDAYPIDQNELDDFIDNIYPENADRLAKCYMHCIMDKTEMVNKMGIFITQRIYDMIVDGHKDDLKEDPMDAINECLTKIPGERLCDRSYTVIKCLADKKLF